MSTLNPDAAKHADIHVAHKGHVDHDAHPHVGKAIQAIHVGLTARNLVDVSLEAARQGLFLGPVYSFRLTTLQSMMNVDLSQQRFWPYPENGLMGTIATIPYNI